MSAAALALDHVGLCHRDLAPMAEAFQALGFTLTPLAQHSGRGASGALERLATGNRCAVLRHGYIELLAILEPGRCDNGLGAHLARHAGLHILALAMDDPAANQARLARGGLEVAVAPLERPVDDADGPRARFERLPFPGAPEGRLQLIRHRTPELLWQERWLDHANGAAALVELILVSAAPAESAARLSRLAGVAFEPGPVAGFVLRFAPGAPVAGPAPAPATQVTILPPAALGAVLPGIVAPALPCMAGLVVRTKDGNRAARALLGGRALPLAEGGLMVPPALAAGAALVFAP